VAAGGSKFSAFEANVSSGDSSSTTAAATSAPLLASLEATFVVSVPATSSSTGEGVAGPHAVIKAEIRNISRLNLYIGLITFSIEIFWRAWTQMPLGHYADPIVKRQGKLPGF
jgi:hypothetical protein